MINKDQCYYLGYVSKVRGFKGEVLCMLDVDDPDAYADMKSVLIDINGTLQPFFTTSVSIDQKGFARITFEGIASRDQATEISGKSLYKPLSELPVLPDEQYYLHELEGMEVVDGVHGLLGKVERVMYYAHNPLIQVFRHDHEILIPLQEAFIEKVDKKARVIKVTVPADLLEMNKI